MPSKVFSRAVILGGIVLGMMLLLQVGMILLLQSSPRTLPISVPLRSSVYTCPAWVSVTRVTTAPRWQLVDCTWQDVDTSGGNHNLYFVVTTENGVPATVYAHQAWPNGDVAQITPGGQTDFGLYGGSFDPNRGEVGPYCGYIQSRATSDVVCGMGLPLNRHVNYFLTYQKVVQSAPPTITLTPGVTPVPSGVSEERVRQLIDEALERGKFK